MYDFVEVRGPVLTAAPEVAEALRSLDPTPVVPIKPVPLEKVGVRVVLPPDVIIPLVATRDVATGAATTVTVVVASWVGSSTDVAVMVTVCAVAGAIQVFPDQVPAVLLQVAVPRAPPVTAELKAVAVETVFIGLAGLMGPTTTVSSVTTALAST
jgi:hypothetical protein